MKILVIHISLQKVSAVYLIQIQRRECFEQEVKKQLIDASHMNNKKISSLENKDDFTEYDTNIRNK